MTRRLGRRSGATVALLTGLLLATPAAPAGAADGPVVTIDSPRADPPLDSATVTVKGSAVADSSLLYAVKSLTLAIGSNTREVACSQSPCSFNWTPPDFKLNGPYQLTVTAREGTLIGLAGPSSETVRKFAVAAPPAKPVLDTPKVTEGRGVDLSWSRNPEGDMLYYALFRKDPGGSTFNRVGGKISQPGSGKVTFSDTGTSAYVGGDYAYQVVAVRKGASGTADTEAKSAPSGAAIASVPAPPDTSTSTLVPGAPLPTAAPTTTVKPGTAAGTDLSGFLSARSQPITVSPITVPEPPDSGFGATLPFGARPPGDELEEGEPDAVPPRRPGGGSIITSIDGSRPLVPVAGGMILLLLALHMRLLNRRIKTADDGDLPVGPSSPPPPPGPAAAETPAPAPPPMPRVAPPPPQPAVEPEPVPEPVPEPALFDVEETDWDEAWAAPVVEVDELDYFDDALDDELDDEPEPEPEPEPEVMPAPAVEAELDVDFELEAEPPPPEDEIPEEEEIEVFDVVSPTRRRLARAGSR